MNECLSKKDAARCIHKCSVVYLWCAIQDIYGSENTDSVGHTCTARSLIIAIAFALNENGE